MMRYQPVLRLLSALCFLLFIGLLGGSIDGQTPPDPTKVSSGRIYKGTIKAATCDSNSSCSTCLQGSYPDPLVPGSINCWASMCKPGGAQFKTCRRGGSTEDCFETKEDWHYACSECKSWKCGPLKDLECWSCPCTGPGFKNYPSWVQWPVCF